jgi:hypothetical protein
MIEIKIISCQGVRKAFSSYLLDIHVLTLLSYFLNDVFLTDFQKESSTQAEFF